MRMIPASPHKTESRAEKRIFDVLRNAFNDADSKNFTAFHSLNLTRHARKRFGEIDFLIVSPFGIYVLEVKGGRVSCEDGVWYYTNKNNERNVSYEGPFKQAESALHGLLKKAEEKLPASIIEEFSIGYGVILPDCRLGVSGAEWDPQIICQDGAHHDIERWLKGLFKYWRSKDFKERYASAESIKLFNQFLRPHFEAVIPLHSRKEVANEEIKQLTESQMDFVDSIEINDRVVCTGGAGTGKTFMAIELARRWTADDSQVILVCRSPWLKNFLKSKFVIPNLTVTTIDGLQMAARRSDVEVFDALIVDEGQDLLSMDALDRLDGFLRGGLSDGRWCFFHDVNNQAGLFGPFDRDALNYLESLNAFKISLKRNCRNTSLILDKIKVSTGADMGILGAGNGPEIRESNPVDEEGIAQFIASELHYIVQDGGLSGSEVTILVDESHSSDFFSCLPEKLRNSIVVLDEFSMQSFPPNNISYSEIGNFKGLENEAIILVGMPRAFHDHDSRARAYVAMSRARSILSIIYAP